MVIYFEVSIHPSKRWNETATIDLNNNPPNHTTIINDNDNDNDEISIIHNDEVEIIHNTPNSNTRMNENTERDLHRTKEQGEIIISLVLSLAFIILPTLAILYFIFYL